VSRQGERTSKFSSLTRLATFKTSESNTSIPDETRMSCTPLPSDEAATIKDESVESFSWRSAEAVADADEGGEASICVVL
jgi:hypothetical protein